MFFWCAQKGVLIQASLARRMAATAPLFKEKEIEEKKKQEQIQLQALPKGIFLSTSFLMCQKRTEKILTSRIIAKYSYFCTKIYQVLHKTVFNLCFYSYCILETFLFEKRSYIIWLKSLRYLSRKSLTY